MVDWSAFYAGLAFIGGIGVMAGIFSEDLSREMAKIEEKASGRTIHC